MNKQLNKKLAVWACIRYESFNNDKHRHYEFQDGWCEDEPNFPNSLDACFKWLVPKLGTYSLWSGRPRFTGIPEEVPVCEHNAEVWGSGISNYGYAHSKESLALALCLAIEKLIK